MTIDHKVYKTDYESEFTSFFKNLSLTDEPESPAKKKEEQLYREINKSRDSTRDVSSRNKIWEDF